MIRDNKELLETNGSTVIMSRPFGTRRVLAGKPERHRIGLRSAGRTSMRTAAKNGVEPRLQMPLGCL